MTEGTILIGKDVVPMSVVKEIRAEIALDLIRSNKDYLKTSDHMDFGVCVGLEIALDTIDKHIPNSVDASKADECSKGGGT